MTKKISKITKEIMKKIEKDNLKIKPRMYFVFGSMLFGVGVVGVMLFSMLLIGVLMFKLRLQGTMNALRFGKVGLTFFVKAFPWQLLLLTILSLIGGYYLIKKQGKAYKIGIGWLMLGILITVFGLGILMDKTGINEKLRQSSKVGRLYKTRFRDKDWVEGEILEIDKKSLIIITPDNEKVKIFFSEKTKMSLKDLKVGEKIKVVGFDKQESFYAKGIILSGLKKGFKMRLDK